jgi:hypothetical protein
MIDSEPEPPRPSILIFMSELRGQPWRIDPNGIYLPFDGRPPDAIVLRPDGRRSRIWRE